MAPDSAASDEPIRFVDVNDPDEGVVAYLRAISEAGAEEAIRRDMEREWMEQADADD